MGWETQDPPHEVLATKWKHMSVWEDQTSDAWRKKIILMKLRILWHVDPFLGNGRGISHYTSTIAIVK
jgi:hypothetical protein